MKLWLKGVFGSWCEIVGVFRLGIEFDGKFCFILGFDFQRLFICYLGKFVVVEGIIGQRRVQVGQCFLDLQFYFGYSSFIFYRFEDIGGRLVYEIFGWGRVDIGEEGQDYFGFGVSVREIGCQGDFVQFNGFL